MLATTGQCRPIAPACHCEAKVRDSPVRVLALRRAVSDLKKAGSIADVDIEVGQPSVLGCSLAAETQSRCTAQRKIDPIESRMSGDPQPENVLVSASRDLTGITWRPLVQCSDFDQSEWP
jgi:hypothetical protein